MLTSRRSSLVTLVFDATALVDGDYEYLDVGRLPDSEPRHMEKVHFHTYTANMRRRPPAGPHGSAVVS